MVGFLVMRRGLSIKRFLRKAKVYLSNRTKEGKHYLSGLYSFKRTLTLTRKGRTKGNQLLKESVMKWKLFWASLVTLSALLTACGGGGGGSSDPVQQQAQPDNSATLVIDARAVALGAKTAPVVVSGSMSGGTLTVDGKSITSDPKALLAGVTVDVAPGNVTAQVVDASGKSLATATTTVTCAKGVWDGTMCAPHKFDQLVLVGFAPFVGDQIGIGVLNLQTGKVTPLGNETGYTTKSTGAWQPVANCGLYLGMTEGNYPTASCEVMTQTGWKWMDFSIEPVRAVLLPYDPTIVAQGLYTGNVPFG
jgi:hypothetical protein